METQVFLNELENKKILSIYGKATMNTSKTISEMIDLILNNKEEVCLDLTNCKYIDSTFLGLIAENTMKSQSLISKFMTIINPNDIVKESLTQTGINKFIIIENIDDIEEKLSNTSKLENKKFLTKLEHAEYVLKMHQILSSLNEKNKETFKNVLSQMEAVLKMQKEANNE